MYKKAQQEMHDAIHFKFTNTWRVGLKRLREEEEQERKKQEERYQKVQQHSGQRREACSVLPRTTRVNIQRAERLTEVY